MPRRLDGACLGVRPCLAADECASRALSGVEDPRVRVRVITGMYGAVKSTTLTAAVSLSCCSRNTAVDRRPEHTLV